MNRKTIIPTASVLLSLVCASLLFLNWNPEALFRREETPVTRSDMEQDGAEDFTGSVAGEDIPRLMSAADFSEMISGLDYATAEPVGIVPTGVYSLKPWVSHYSTNTYKGRTTTGSRRAEVSTSGLDILGNYNPYYLLELPDHSYILAQIPQMEADAIAEGESVTLPIGQKAGMTDAAWSRLAAVCGEYGADMDGVFYAFDNEWQEEHHTTLLLLRFGAAALLWFMLAVGLTLLGNGLILKRKTRGMKGEANESNRAG